ncbi:MAG: aldehyde dehydrogenase [Deltaproteobacteria bacterium]|nr:aldehyde dehydrogenase [Deltaproteobacteria bacterium]
MHQIDLLIGNAPAPAEGGRTFDRIDPLTGEVATRAAAASVADGCAAVDAAAAALPSWAALGPGARRAKLLTAAAALESEADAFARTMIAETGCTGHWGHFNVGLAANMMREAAASTTRITGDVIPTEVPDNLAMAIRQPRGVCLGIAPWNAPVVLGVRALAMPLACGNTVVLKASDICPATHRLIGACLAESGLPEGVVNVVSVAPDDAPEVVAAMIAHRAVKHVNFTGSTEVGRAIAQTAARHLKPVLLELGGKAPLVVLDDADLDEAVKAATFGAFANQGQICMSTERVVVDERVADAFVERFVARANGLSIGDPRKGGCILGAMVHDRAVARLAELLKDARAKGARIVAGGEAEGPLMGPTIVDQVTADMRLYHEESFGPIAVIVRVDGDEQAISTANDTEYGLSAAVFSKDLARGLAVARRIESGICHINGPTVHDEPQMPFGGVKGSGYGRFGGQAAIEAFTELRWITIQTGPRHYPF